MISRKDRDKRERAAEISRRVRVWAGASMKLWVGLGNPGAKYAHNRHNVGFLAVDAIASAHGFGPWRSKFNGQIAEGRVGSEKVLLLKPETFMNLSGDSVVAALAFFKLAPAEMTVLHDELDLEPGKLRLKTGGGHAGHNGLRSIQGHIGPDFHRLRIGIGHPGDKALVTHHVLGDFAKADQDWLAPLLEGIAQAAPLLASNDGPGFLNAVTRRMSPPAVEKTRPTVVKSEPEAGSDLSPLQRLADRFR